MLAASAARAEFELGARYWGSTGMTRWAHAAPGLGNPTSILTYSDLEAHAGELHFRAAEDRWFIKGNLGIGRIRSGSFDDEDYNAAQVKIFDTTSSVRGDSLTYFSFDFGHELWVWRGGANTLGIFGGWQRWNERVDAYGLTPTLGPFTPRPDSVLVISNDVTWTSLRVGVASRNRFHPRLRLDAELALVPYTRMRNEDSHHLRQSPNDLGPVPNVINEGSGNGIQAEVELRWMFYESYELGLGARYWWLETTKGTNRAAGSSFPLVFQESERTGVTLSVSRRW